MKRTRIVAISDIPQPEVSTAFDGKAFCETLPGQCGIYRCLDAEGNTLYVGKARDLKKRVSSYFLRSAQQGPKVRAMVAQIRAIEVTVTHTEDEALLLENNLIKKLHPRYNIVLRDDKSYPYIYVATDQDYPRLSFHRGARSGKGRYFGPYPSASAVRASLNLLQKLFRLRPCSDSFFKNRTRPCLQYQIERCSGPCVGLIDPAAYRSDVEHAMMFLEGRSQEIIDVLVQRMEDASGQLAFERAAQYRDQINQLKRVQQRQYISGSTRDIDIVACATRGDIGCVQVFFVRAGHNLGNKAYFPAHTANAEPAEILAAFMPQHYLSQAGEQVIPSEIVISETFEDRDWLAEILSKRTGRQVAITHRVRGEKARWIEMARQNAELALAQRVLAADGQAERLEALRKALDLPLPVERIECFDVSHTHGESTVASCVVFGPDGALKSDYRRFNIEGVAAGDDYAALRQALQRRYSRVQKEAGVLPSVLLIDGGKGQVAQAREVLDDLQIDNVLVVGVAKGPTRKPGLETVWVLGQEAPLDLPADSSALHLIQRVRDEAHRFAITGHRNRRSNARGRSSLEQIEGVGAKRRRQLIQYFGGLQGVARAGVDDLSKVPGISKQLAAKIYNYYHETA